MASMSAARASVTTSASRPSITERACLPDPPCDERILTFSPVCCFHLAANAWLTSWYNSRVGSYETFSSSTSLAMAPPAANAMDRPSSRLERMDFTWSLLWGSERELRAGQENFFVFTLQPGGCRVEGSLVVIGDELEVAGEVPVDAHAPAAGARNCHCRVGEQRESVVVDIQAAIAGDQFKGPPACPIGCKGMVWTGHAAVAVVLAGQDHATAELPGPIVQGGLDAAGGGEEVLVGGDVFGQEPESSVVEIRLRGPAGVLPVGKDVAAIAEELHLSGRPVARQVVVAEALLVARASGDAEPQPGQV